MNSGSLIEPSNPILDSLMQSLSDGINSPENDTKSPTLRAEASENSCDDGSISVLSLMSDKELFHVLMVISLLISMLKTPLPSPFDDICVTFPVHSETDLLVNRLHKAEALLGLSPPSCMSLLTSLAFICASETTEINDFSISGEDCSILLALSSGDLSDW